ESVVASHRSPKRNDSGVEPPRSKRPRGSMGQFLRRVPLAIVYWRRLKLTLFDFCRNNDQIDRCRRVGWAAPSWVIVWHGKWHPVDPGGPPDHSPGSKTRG